MKTVFFPYAIFFLIAIVLISCGGKKDDNPTFLKSTSNEEVTSNENPAKDEINEPLKPNDMEVNNGEKETNTIKEHEINDGVYQFVLFDKEYNKSTAKCNVFVDGKHVSVIVTQPILDDIYNRNEKVYDGRLKKVGKLWYIIEKNNTLSPSDEDFDFETPRIDFKRKLIIYY